jgi:hypothetical protein
LSNLHEVYQFQRALRRFIRYDHMSGKDWIGRRYVFKYAFIQVFSFALSILIRGCLIDFMMSITIIVTGLVENIRL